MTTIKEKPLKLIKSRILCDRPATENPALGT